MPLDSFFTTQDGFVCRHLYDNNPLSDLVALRWWRDGNVRLTIPIRQLYVTPQSLRTDKQFEKFVLLMGDFSKLYHKVLDLNQWLFAVFALTHRYLDLRDLIASTEPIYAKFVFSNAKLGTPFIAMDSYLRAVKKFGIPVVQDSLITCPVGLDPASFALLTDHPYADDLKRVYELMIPLAISALQSLGVTLDPGSEGDLGRDFTLAMQRGSGQASVTSSGHENA